MRVSAPVTLSKTTDNPARKPSHDAAERQRHPIPGPTFHDQGRPPHTGHTNFNREEQRDEVINELLPSPYRADAMRVPLTVTILFAVAKINGQRTVFVKALIRRTPVIARVKASDGSAIRVVVDVCEFV